jgi:hypothetical protein
VKFALAKRVFLFENEINKLLKFFHGERCSF